MVDIKGKKYVVLSEIVDAVSAESVEGKNFINNLPGIFLLTNVSKRNKKNGGIYLSCLVRDKKISMDSRIWDWKGDIPESGQIVVADYSYDQNFGLALNLVRGKISVSEALKREDLIDVLDVLIPKVDVENLKKELERLVDTISNDKLKKLLRILFFGDEEFSKLFFKSPAASTNHHVRIGGLLEHSVRLAKMCEAIAEFFEGFVDKDLLISGSLIHDIGKVYSYNFEDLSFEMTNEGLLEDHIVIGIKLLTKAIQKIDEFPKEFEELLTHIVVSHHGLKEWGSPVPPKTLEAIIIHNLDRLEAQADAYIETLKNTPNDRSWSSYIPMLGSSVFISRKLNDEKIDE
ncbi:MAG: HD domain-containing protein [Thermotogae bacterium]|nr:HD domain-containing protein [Thermotogota bacterium]